MNKVVLSKPKGSQTIPVLIKAIPKGGDTKAYQQRKAMDSQYKDIFRALFALPDKDVQKRVLDAINGVPCSKCAARKSKSVETATQTENAKDAKLPVILNRAHERVTKPPKVASPPDTSDEKTEPKRRRRKRRVCLPQVLKRSHAEMQLQQLPLLAKKRKVQTDVRDHEKTNDIWDIPPIVKQRDQRQFSIASDVLLESLSDFTLFDSKPMEDHILHRMAVEVIESAEMHNGLLPIHDAILKNNENSLKRQIYVWKKIKKVDLNELITDEDEDCLQLSIVNDCYPGIIEELLNSGLDVNCLDDASNTVIHLAIINEIELKSLEMLMQRIDLQNLLLTNNDGFTPLHLAIRQNMYLHAEIILNNIDSRRTGTIMYKCDSTQNKNISTFQEYYEKICNLMELEDFQNINKRQLKQQLLNMGDARSGTTPLLCALEKNFEHLIYFLLAHLADPRIRNHGGTNPRIYLCEFGKSVGLNFKIDKIMEKVQHFLKKLR